MKRRTNMRAVDQVDSDGDGSVPVGSQDRLVFREHAGEPAFTHNSADRLVFLETYACRSSGRRPALETPPGESRQRDRSRRPSEGSPARASSRRGEDRSTARLPLRHPVPRDRRVVAWNPGSQRGTPRAGPRNTSGSARGEWRSPTDVLPTGNRVPNVRRGWLWPPAVSSMTR